MISWMQITEERSKLPIASFRDAITSTIDSNQVILIVPYMDLFLCDCIIYVSDSKDLSEK